MIDNFTEILEHNKVEPEPLTFRHELRQVAKLHSAKGQNALAWT